MLKEKSLTLYGREQIKTWLRMGKKKIWMPENLIEIIQY